MEKALCWLIYITIKCWYCVMWFLFFHAVTLGCLQLAYSNRREVWSWLNHFTFSCAVLSTLFGWFCLWSCTHHLVGDHLSKLITNLCMLLFNYLKSSDSLKQATSEEVSILNELCKRYGANLDEAWIFGDYLITLCYFVCWYRITQCIIHNFAKINCHYGVLISTIFQVKCMKSNYFDVEVQNLPLLDGRIDVSLLFKWLHLLKNVDWFKNNGKVSQLVGNYSIFHKQLGDIDELDFLRDEFYLSTHRLGNLWRLIMFILLIILYT